MGSGNFLTALESMTEWIGDIILPTLAAFCVMAAILAYSARRDGQKYVLGAVLCLMGPGFAMLISYFTTSTPPTTTSSVTIDSYSGAIMNAASYFGNVIMPLFAVLNIVRGILTLGGFMERFNVGDDWMRYFVVATSCMMVSGIVRLLEYFVTNAATLTPGTTSTSTTSTSMLIDVAGKVVQWHCG